MKKNTLEKYKDQKLKWPKPHYPEITITNNAVTCLAVFFCTFLFSAFKNLTSYYKHFSYKNV